MMKTFLIAAATATLATPAFAEPVTVFGSSDAPQARVVYGDLNLSDEAGLDTLKQRIRGAAKNMCLVHYQATLSERAARQQCYSTARADGYAQADALHDRAAQGFAYAVDAAFVVAASNR
ncbi:UrcA family protein [Sphingomicrobium marinum]|uniref:UrcA family protein n=1 Tax=Sphingomicrobium marinum TaxID=1227950 RepID=UPI002240A706|nr:UrcA family protein [Sphingomicrobium marinum]